MPCLLRGAGPRCFVAQHGEQVGDARIAALLAEQGRELTAMMGLMIEDVGRMLRQFFDDRAPAGVLEFFGAP